MNLKKSLKKLDEERVKIKKGNLIFLPYYLCIVIAGSISDALGAEIAVTAIVAIIVGAIVGIFHYSQVGLPFQELSTKVRRMLIKNYMQTYHPEIKYEYFRDDRRGKAFLKEARLINPDKYFEGNVITGKYKNTHFYLSEIELQNKQNKIKTKLFKGMLFRLNIPGRNFPRSRIQSKLGLLKTVLNRFEKEKTYGFHYETKDLKQFNKTLGPLFPFIQHLIKKQGDIRIETNNDDILILLESSVKFLDEPRQSVHRSFHDQVYYENMVKQLNSFLYIVEAFTNEVDIEEIDDILELRMFEILENEEN